MNNKKLRVLSFVLVCTMLIMTVLTGCGKKSGENGAVSNEALNPLGSDPISKEKVTLEFMMPNNGNVEDYETNKYTKEIERMGNIEIKFNLLSPADSDTVINLTLSSGKDLPDVINTTLSDDLVTTYGSSGAFVVLNDYYENSSYYLKPQLEAYKADTTRNWKDANY